MKRKIELPDAMDDDCRRLTQEMPEGVLQDEAEVRPAKRMSADGCLRAFTVHPGWAWAIMEGVKTQEWRTFLPHPAEGVCAIHVSKSYCKAQWEFEAKQVRKQFGVKLIPYEELVADWCGKVVGVCDYAADEGDLDGGFVGTDPARGGEK